MDAHKIQKGICTQCGCDRYAIEYFGWSCCGRSIRHTYKGTTCINCGFGKNVIEHFDWPCRLDFHKAHSADASHRPHDRQGQDRKHSERFYEQHEQAWPYTNEEIRYGQLLGLKGKVTKGDIKCAYREQASLYHPDKVAHLAIDIQRLATEKMKEINQAFAYFREKYDL